MPQCSVEFIFIISVVIHAKATAFNNNYETKNPNVIGKFYSINAVKLGMTFFGRNHKSFMT